MTNLRKPHPDLLPPERKRKKRGVVRRFNQASKITGCFTGTGIQLRGFRGDYREYDEIIY